ncbi:MAG: tRNA (adenosine(37)-N6)-threonylcarbamoyltransferase complex ATPase subunit type 1 TsaE [Alphaproteobacteria bacterium]|nr:tRNA (adenosine(37)-N6)-threonylcarbamoyltransferase complex ATPase subunit type 1 TsaE [Alphaproteobacteria bacterium]
MPTWDPRTADETRALGAALGALAPAGLVVALQGDLGAGKTCFSQGVGQGLGVRGPVTSPTFILLAVHEGGRLPLYHADLYRLGDPSELDELGLEEVLGSDGVALVEWADRFPELMPADHVVWDIAFTPQGRRMAARGTGPASRAALQALCAQVPPSGQGDG